MPADVHSMAPCQIASTVVPVERVSFSGGVITEPHQHSGNEFVTLIRTSGATPRIRLSMPFRAAYDLLALGVNELSAFHLYLAKFAALIRATGSVHTRWSLSTNAKAAAMITGWSVNQDGILLADVEIVPLAATGGTAHPLTRTDNNALLALASQPTVHTLGPVSINGTVIPGLTASSVDLGQNLVPQRTDGALYPVIAPRVDAAPRMTLTHADPRALLAGLGDLLGSSVAVVAYYRQYAAADGTIDTGATAVSVTAASCRITPIDMDVGQGEVATIGFEVAGLSSTSTHPFAVAVNATAPAIP